MLEQRESISGSEIGGATQRKKRVRPYGLQARMSALYIKITLGIIILLFCLYAAFLVGNLSYTLAHTPMASGERLPALQGYPIAAGLVMLMVTLIIAPLVGGFFGTIATRDLLRRVQALIGATKQIADGDYRRRVSITESDEIGQLERQFNAMAAQLAESVARQRELAGQKARLAERVRITRELHDAISQNLFSLRMLIDGLHLALPVESPLQSRVVMLEETTATMIHEMRALLLELRPAQLEHAGLCAALEHLVAGYRERLNIAVTTTLVEFPLAEGLEHILLRIAQEALSNAVRHADATLITVSLIPQNGAVVLIIEDNGKGFVPTEGGTQYGMGLRLMQERVQELHGNFSLESVPDQGTRVQVFLPLEL